MKRLSKNWITEKHLDKEYKQYVLLAYLQEVEKQFSKTKLYPHYNELKYHHKLLSEIDEKTTELFSSFPKKSVGINWENLSLKYLSEIKEPKLMNEIKEIIEFSIPKIENFMLEGNQILEFIENQVCVSPIGIVPLERDEGYFFLGDSDRNKVLVYQYHITLFDKADAPHRKIKAHYKMSFRKSYLNTRESIKSTLIDQNRELPNPATFAIDCSLSLPINETYLPIAKMMLARHIDWGQDHHQHIN